MKRGVQLSRSWMYGVIDVPKAVPTHLHIPYESACPSCVVSGNLLFPLSSLQVQILLYPFSSDLVFQLHEYLVAGCVIGSL